LVMHEQISECSARYVYSDDVPHFIAPMMMT
jgi:hypothetical protein